MILKSFEINKINKKINQLILFYGKNNGLKNEALSALIKNESNIQNYEEKEILDNENDFIENVLSKSLFEENKTIIIKRSSDKILATRLKNYSLKKNNLFFYELKLLTSENKLILSKDTKGDPLLLGLKINLKIEVYEKDKLIVKKEYNEQFNYQNLSKKFELNSYESEIRSNIYDKMITKILIDLTNLK